MQAVYYLPSECHVKTGQSLSLQASHDEFSFWFEEISKTEENQSFSRPYCRCLIHSILSKHSIFRINSIMQDRRINEWLKEVCLYENETYGNFRSPQIRSSPASEKAHYWGSKRPDMPKKSLLLKKTSISGRTMKVERVRLSYSYFSG